MTVPTTLLVQRSLIDAFEHLPSLTQRGRPGARLEVFESAAEVSATLDHARIYAVICDLSTALATLPDQGSLPSPLVCVVIDEQGPQHLRIDAIRAGARAVLRAADLWQLAPTLERALDEAEAVHRVNRQMAMLRESEARLALATRGSNDGLWDWDLSRDVIFYSTRWKRMLGYSEGDIGDSPSEWLDRIHPDDRSMVEWELRRHADGETSQLNVEYRMKNRYGAVRWMLARGQALRFGDGRSTRIAGSQTDITARKLTEGRLAYAAAHDPLTGLPNRSLFMDRLRHAVRRYQRSRSDIFAVLFVDIDRFRLVIDGLGHVAGDEMLLKVAHRVSRCLRPSDTVARFGGNVFAVLLEAIDGEQEAMAVTLRVHGEISRKLDLRGNEIHPSASIGVKLSTPPIHGAEEILKAADTALSKAKSVGAPRLIKGFVEWETFKAELDRMLKDTTNKTKGSVQKTLAANHTFHRHKPELNAFPHQLSGTLKIKGLTLIKNI